MEDSADIEFYEEIVGNPAYSSSSDTSKSDTVSFQFKEPRLTEWCREEYFFARARSRPDPRIHLMLRQKYSRAAILRHVCRVWEFSKDVLWQQYNIGAHFKYIYIRHICDSGAW